MGDEPRLRGPFGDPSWFANNLRQREERERRERGEREKERERESARLRFNRNYPLWGVYTDNETERGCWEKFIQEPTRRASHNHDEWWWSTTGHIQNSPRVLRSQ